MSALAAAPVDEPAPSDPVDTAPAAKPAAGTLLGSDIADDPAPAEAATEQAAPEADAKADETPEYAWPDDWRDKMASGDEDIAKAIRRYGSPAGVAKALKEAQALIRSGKLKRDMPSEGDEKALAEWRKEQGIPDKPEAYKAPQIKGFEWSDEDKPVLLQFFEHAHAKGLPQSSVDGALEWYASYVQEQETRIYERDTQALAAAEDKLRMEFGPEYRANMKLAAQYLDSLPIPRTELMNARLPDGTRLGDNPTFAMWAVEQARSIYGDGGFLSGDAQSAHANRKAEIEGVMKTDITEYYRKNLDKEYAEILQREQNSARRR